MKKFFSILILSIFVLSANAFAQTEFFSAKEGYATAVSEASAFIDTPQLLFIGTSNSGDDDQMGINYDPTNGKATGWVYLFNDSEVPGNVIGVFVIKAFMYFGFVLDPEDLELDIPMNFELFFGSDWLDSDAASVELLKCSDYSKYIESNKFPEDLQIALFYNVMYESYPLNAPVWAVRIPFEEEEDEISSAVNIINKDIYCSSVMSVKDILGTLERLEIQHYGNTIKIQTDAMLDDNLVVSVFSVDGSTLFEQSYSNISGELSIFIPFDSFSSGSFYVTARGKNTFGFKPIVIAK